ncbi:MAG: Xaa-Pro aminopeptidase [Pseudomonadota bacterium]|nr:Xaa-Pro aminopeptidase [Pseudomonadota bacterium]
MITQKEYQKRRTDLMKRLPAQSIMIIPSGEEVLRSGDVHYPFRQQSDFLYLTGFSEPHSILVLKDGKSWLFNAPQDDQKTVWTGPVLGQMGAIAQLGMDEAYPVGDFEVYLHTLLEGVTAIYYPFLQGGQWEKKLFSTWKQVRSQRRQDRALPSAFHDVSPWIASMRLFKSPDEIRTIQKVVDISVDAHIAVMQQISSCEYEYQAAAIFHQHLQQQGIMEVAYPSIVASGENACILHYTEYHRAFQSTDLLLIDAGGEYKGYAADLTRTYPVRGRWTFEQQAIYELVLAAQKAAIAVIKPQIQWSEIQKTILSFLTQGLKDLGILQGTLSGLLEQQAYKSFYMHGSGHWLGMDVHDVGAYEEHGQSIRLQSSMVLTVEPGLYFSPQLSHIDERWRGIGVRIEDDVLVTEQGNHVFSHRLPKEVDDLQSIGCLC